ncbi:MAG: hypothetical protein M1822_008240 [Bathelium mastoideum]|nr:MAG: hypothetical protein M1822_008240 [Bathelium mastoideum]
MGGKKEAKVEAKGYPPADLKVAWRELSVNDIEGLMRVADEIHTELPESSEPPPLDSLLGDIAPDANQYYIHDLAILPQMRGRGLAQECMEKISAIAKRYSTTSLVSVYGTAPFWGRFGFRLKEVDDVLRKKLLDYGDNATYLERNDDEHQQQTTATTS